MIRLKHPLFYFSITFCVILAVFLQELDERVYFGEGQTDHGMILSADAPGYTAPAINWIDKGIWKDNSFGSSALSQRPPGYGMIISCCYLIAGTDYLYVLKVLQILAFFGTIWLVYSVLKQLGTDSKRAGLAAVVFGLLPCYSSTMYFVLTEGITPFLFLLSCYSWLKWIQENKRKGLFIASASFLLLVRPQLLIPVVLLIIYILIRERKAFVLFVFLPLTLWQVRTFTLTGSVKLHPIYFWDNQSLYRPAHEAMTDLYRVWEADGREFHEAIDRIANDPGSEALEETMEHVPMAYRSAVRPVLFDYQQLLFNERKLLLSGFELGWNRDEQNFIDKTEKLTKQLRREHKLDYYLKTPGKSAYSLLAKSHLHFRFIQDNKKDHLFIRMIALVCTLILLVSLLFTTLLLIMKNVPDHIKVLALGIVLSILYLAFFQRMNEERYLTPFLPVAFILSAYLVLNRKTMVQK